jgi:HD-GYP domain-containing protein (c-di-GMP phosphodiesterase class II)
MAIHLDDPNKFLIHHSVNVAIFALKMGTNLGFNKDQQLRIAMAALMHDVGTALIPEKIIHKKDRLNQQEFQVIRERPKYSYDILRSFGDDHTYLAECALQVYERIDGSGYPQGLKGDEIHEYAQIIGLVDMYEALIHSRPQRKKLLHLAAVKDIIQTSKNCFQRKHLKTLLSIFSIFPIYSYVRLNSEAIGKVIETYPDQPMRPKLQIVYDSQKRKVLTERIINLPEHPLLHIMDSVSEEDIKELADA